ncbi:MAG: CD1107 family mobile element protein [Oscillospiraceae bacterium]
MKLRKTFKTILVATTIATLSLLGGMTSSAESNTSSSTSVTSSSSTSSSSSSTTPTSKPNPSTSGSSSSTAKPSNPRLEEVLKDEEMYRYLLEYLENPEAFDLDGAGVLIGEDVITNPSTSYSKTSDEEDGVTHNADENGEKLMFTVATRDGSIFYIIVDKSGNSENVYFLNSVDMVDLASLIKSSKDEETPFTPQEQEIIDAANNKTSTPDTTTSGDSDGNLQADNSNSTNEDNSSSSTSNPSGSDGKKDYSFILYIVIGVVAAVIIGIAAYKKVGPGKNKKAVVFDEPDEEYEEEEFFEDDSSEE